MFSFGAWVDDDSSIILFQRVIIQTVVSELIRLQPSVFARFHPPEPSCEACPETRLPTDPGKALDLVPQDPVNNQNKGHPDSGLGATSVKYLSPAGPI